MRASPGAQPLTLTAGPRNLPVRQSRFEGTKSIPRNLKRAAMRHPSSTKTRQSNWAVTPNVGQRKARRTPPRTESFP